MSEKMGRNIIFYSNLDAYSKKILNIISGQKRDSEFVFICVDDRNIQLPSFLKVVPTIFLVKEQNVLVDESIEEYLMPPPSPTQYNSNSQGNEASNNDLDAYFDSNNGFSSNYSNLDDSETASNNSMFSYIQNDDLTGGASNNGMERPKGSLDNAFEKLANERQNDFAGIQRV